MLRTYFIMLQDKNYAWTDVSSAWISSQARVVVACPSLIQFSTSHCWMFLVCASGHTVSDSLFCDTHIQYLCLTPSLSTYFTICKSVLESRGFCATLPSNIYTQLYSCKSETFTIVMITLYSWFSSWVLLWPRLYKQNMEGVLALRVEE